MEENCYGSSEIPKHGFESNDVPASGGRGLFDTCNQISDFHSEQLFSPNLTATKVELLLRNDEEKRPVGRRMHLALKSMYDYTGKIKSFIEQDYGCFGDGCNKLCDKSNATTIECDSPAEAIEKVVSNLISTVMSDVLGSIQDTEARKLEKEVSALESPPPYQQRDSADMLRAGNDSVPENETINHGTVENTTPYDSTEVKVTSSPSLSEFREANKQSNEKEVDRAIYNDELRNNRMESNPTAHLGHVRSVSGETAELIPTTQSYTAQENLAYENIYEACTEADRVPYSEMPSPAAASTASESDANTESAKKKRIINTQPAPLTDTERGKQKNEIAIDGHSSLVTEGGFHCVEQKEYYTCLQSNVDFRPKLPNEHVDEEKRKTFPSESFLDNNDVNLCSNDIYTSAMKVEDIDPDTVCGIGAFKPQWLQQWATSKTFLVFFSVVGVLQGSYYTYLIGIMTTLEKRYAFESKISGTIMMVDEITPMFLGVVVGYFGGKAHRPRVVAFGMFISALCCFITALPYFMYGTSKHLMSDSITNATRSEHCEREHMRIYECSSDDRPPTMAAVACLVIGSFVKGFGGLAYYAVGMAYMDDSTKKTNTPIYLAICTAFRLLGPTLGFLMSSATLKFYENPFEDPGFGNDDPRWVGAWWIGFVLQGLLLCIFSFPIFLFPRRLPKQRQRALSNTANFYQESMSERIGGMLKAVKRLAINPIFLLYSAGVICSITGGFGMFTYMPKYMENQFHISASSASLYSGPPSIAAVQVCSMIGGILIWKLKPNAKKLIFAMFLTGILDIASYCVLMIPMCPQVTMTGATVTDKGVILENSCNVGCDCSSAVFTPVCGPDGVSTYFSPCHAGCAIKDVGNPNQFFNCSCIVGSDGNFTFASSVNRGYCTDEQCWIQTALYAVIMTITSGVTSIARVAFSLILFRSVDPADKSIALGAFETLLCGLAFMPYPVIYGALADSSCLIWEKSCGETGNCWLYDVSKFNYRLHGASAAYAAGSTLFFGGMVFLSGRVRNLYEEDDTAEKDQENASPQKLYEEKRNTTTQL